MYCRHDHLVIQSVPLVIGNPCHRLATGHKGEAFAVLRVNVQSSQISRVDLRRKQHGILVALLASFMKLVDITPSSLMCYICWSTLWSIKVIRPETLPCTRQGTMSSNAREPALFAATNRTLVIVCSKSYRRVSASLHCNVLVFQRLLSYWKASEV